MCVSRCVVPIVILPWLAVVARGSAKTIPRHSSPARRRRCEPSSTHIHSTRRTTRARSPKGAVVRHRRAPELARTSSVQPPDMPWPGRPGVPAAWGDLDRLRGRHGDVGGIAQRVQQAFEQASSRLIADRMIEAGRRRFGSPTIEARNASSDCASAMSSDPRLAREHSAATAISNSLPSSGRIPVAPSCALPIDASAVIAAASAAMAQFAKCCCEEGGRSSADDPIGFTPQPHRFFDRRCSIATTATRPTMESCGACEPSTVSSDRKHALPRSASPITP